MLNYIWAGLIILSLVFASWADVRDAAGDTYRNRKTLPVSLEVQSGDLQTGTSRVRVLIDPATYAEHYGVEQQPLEPFEATVTATPRGHEIRFDADAPLPPLLTKVRDATSYEEQKRLTARVVNLNPTEGVANAELRFEPVRLQKMKAIASAAIDASKAAVTLALGLIGVLALWLGLARIAEKAGLIELVVKMIQPILRPLFPDIPRNHPAMGMIALNLTANFLGLGNAATPFGIKAMEELQQLNPQKETATNSMVMFLAMNTAGVQLVPPVMLIAVIGLRAVDLIIPIWICTALSLVIAIIAAKLLGMLPMYRRTDPMNQLDKAPAQA